MSDTDHARRWRSLRDQCRQTCRHVDELMAEPGRRGTSQQIEANRVSMRRSLVGEMALAAFVAEMEDEEHGTRPAEGAP